MAMKIAFMILVIIVTGSCFKFFDDSVEKRCTSEPVDLALLIDSSASIIASGSLEMAKVKNFAKEYLKNYDISEQGTHVAIIRYSDTPELLVKFGTYDRNTINSKIDSIYAEGNTYINLALHMANEQVFTKEAGMREGVKRILVLFTDGVQSKYDRLAWDLVGPSNKMKNRKDVKIYTLGVGNIQSEKEKRIQRESLTRISSGDGYHFFATNFDKLSKIAEEIVDKQCEDIIPTNPPTQPTPSPTTKYESGNLVTPTEKPFDPCRRVDVALLLDSSNSMNNRQWNEVVAFATRAAEAFKIGPKDSHIAIIRYNRSPKLLMKFNTLKGEELNNENVNIRIENMEKYTYGFGKMFPFIEGLTFIDRAFEMANDEVFIEEAGMRSNVLKLCILVTDGRQTTNHGAYTTPHQAAQLLKDRGIQIITVGVGSKVNGEELSKTASSPDLSFSDIPFSQLKSNAKDIALSVCRA